MTIPEYLFTNKQITIGLTVSIDFYDKNGLSAGVAFEIKNVIGIFPDVDASLDEVKVIVTASIQTHISFYGYVEKDFLDSTTDETTMLSEFKRIYNTLSLKGDLEVKGDGGESDKRVEIFPSKEIPLYGLLVLNLGLYFNMDFKITGELGVGYNMRLLVRLLEQMEQPKTFMKNSTTLI